MHHTTTHLEFDRILDRLCEYAASEQARETLRGLSPAVSERDCRRRLAETTQARTVLDACGTPPLPMMGGLETLLELCRAGAMLDPEQLEKIQQFLASCRRVKDYLIRAQSLGVPLTDWAASVDDLRAVYDEIDRCIRNGLVDSAASGALRDVRRKIETARAQIKNKLASLLQGKKQWFSDGAIVSRNGRLVLPVRRECRNQVPGSVIDVSGTGGTVFIEPAAVTKLQGEVGALQIEEENEVRRVLYTLSAMVDDHAREMRLNIECMTALDVLFAKARLSAALDAREPLLTSGREIHIRAGRHPLLARESCVPLEFDLGPETRGVVVTGPNTGGKTVALKTVGLLSLMAQSGLHVPAAEGTALCMNAAYLCDIGDGQSISENLSTFSSHMTQVNAILREADRDSLVLLDELGSGTDPAEGMGLAVAILEELRQRGCLFVVTTHYPEVKEYAAGAPGVVNARMAFDRATLRPLYRLEQGEAGESCALYIAQRLGLPEHVLERARLAAAGGRVAYGPEAFAEGHTLRRDAKEQPPEQREARFNVGDSVLLPDGEAGIVYRPEDGRGDVVVHVAKTGEKRRVFYKRLTLRVRAAELYPEGYDFSIVFDSVNVRKARHQMDKRHQPGLEIELPEEG